MFITNDPERKPRGTGTYTAFLSSHGRMLHDVFLYPKPEIPNDPDGPGWLIEVDKTEVKNISKHLNKLKLRAKLRLRILDDGERTVWSAWNDHSEPKWAAYNLGSSNLTSPLSPSESIIGCVDTRAPGFGSRIITLGAEDLRTHLPDEEKVPGKEVELDVYTVRRMLHGIPEGQAEIIRESSFPLECNLDMMRGVDFRKGCYIGQELTTRTNHTGVVRKRVLPVQLYTDSQDVAEITDKPVYDPFATDIPMPPSGTNIYRVTEGDERKGRSVGKFLGGIGNIGLATCRLDMMTDITPTGEPSQYTPGQEFSSSWNTVEEGSQTTLNSGVKVKAIVPPWTRKYILSDGARKRAPRIGDDGEGLRARDMVEQLDGEVKQRRN